MLLDDGVCEIRRKSKAGRKVVRESLVSELCSNDATYLVNRCRIARCGTQPAIRHKWLAQKTLRSNNTASFQGIHPGARRRAHGAVSVRESRHRHDRLAFLIRCQFSRETTDRKQDPIGLDVGVNVLASARALEFRRTLKAVSASCSHTRP